MTTYSSRKEIPVEETWNITDIYSEESEWQKDYESIQSLAQELAGFEGEISDGQSLFQFLKKQEDLSYLFGKVYAYAMLQSDVDTRDSRAQSLLDQSKQLSVKVSSATSFFMPFLLSLDEATLKAYIKEEEGLQYFEEDLLESFRYKAHVLSTEQESLLSQLGESLSAPSNTYNMINNADIEFGLVTNDNGEKVELTRGMYAKLIESDDRQKRKEAYKAYYKPYVQLKNTIGSTLSAAIKNNVTTTRIRQYPSALEKALFGDNVPKEVYHNLIQSTRDHLQTMHKYTALRKELLQLDELRQYDLSAQLVKDVDMQIPYEEAFATMCKALAPLGEEYISTLQSFKEHRYIDVRETKGKRSGAYNMGVYGVHPYILLNHRDDLDSMFTLAHECGHGVHSKWSAQHQPQITAGYSIFVAEVASTVNEVLLIKYLLDHETNEDIKRHLLNHFIDQFKGTFFTQVMFSEFEWKTHQLAEEGKTLNTEVFNGIYEQLFKDYHGESLVLDEEVKYGWSRIPHFYRPFYVYKYATGYASAIQLATKIYNGDEETLKTYLEFLKSGSSEFPLDLLKNTGVDLTTSKPIDEALQTFEELVEEFASLS
ncbi:oligoendopeptidase F [Cytobacillus sp. FSL W7-1323]|uniref:oligoendopeptidase F n=1 Tax=Cytobacillus sp. FSL W7-1323 TaxID=2921700 RepID=UPI0031599336